MTPSDEVRLRHMLDAARKAVKYTKGVSREDFAGDEIKVLAMTRLIEVIGEAAKRTSDEIRMQSPEIPWKEIAGTRDRLIHGYFNIDLDILWQILTDDLPTLIGNLEQLLQAESE
jgi:uncharacterized protein with HEPN domain